MQVAKKEGKKIYVIDDKSGRSRQFLAAARGVESRRLLEPDQVQKDFTPDLAEQVLQASTLIPDSCPAILVCLICQGRLLRGCGHQRDLPLHLDLWLMFLRIVFCILEHSRFFSLQH